MRYPVLLATVLVAVLVLGTVPLFAQANTGIQQFPRSNATITLTNSGMTVSPEQLPPGSVTFTVKNNSDDARGLYITGNDRVGNPIVRYSPKIMPGSSITMEFWLYQGNTYSLKDYTSKSESGGKSMFQSTYTKEMTVPTIYPIGSGPQFERQVGSIVITNQGLDVSGMSEAGPVMFTVTNRTSRTRGVVITGRDRANSPIVKYTQMIRPGHSVKLSFWLYGGQTYKVSDYTSRYARNGEMRFTSSFNREMSVPSVL